MDTVDMNLTTPTEVSVTAVSAMETSVSIEDVKKSDVLDNFDIDDIIEHFGKEGILDNIGQDSVVEHFGLELKED